ncbi:thioredoxin [Candidatus Curtissbacteria bacterium]|nr:thioredoxin [Candidatus Curtissbacteria bacterium]
MIKLLDFWAEWCGPCKLMHPIIEDMKKKYDGKIEFVEINVDETPDDSIKYNVASIPTYIILKDDVEVARHLGATTPDKFDKFLSDNLV